MDKSKIYLDLSKLSKEQRKNIAKVFFKTNTLISSITLEMLNGGSIVDSDGDKCFTFLMKAHKEWSGHTKSEIKGKTEFTYPEFIKLFEGRESDGWIKIESEADLPKEVGDYWAVWKDGEVARKQFFCRAEKNIYSPNGNISEYDWWIRYITHYQPIIKPEPPKL